MLKVTALAPEATFACVLVGGGRCVYVTHMHHTHAPHTCITHMHHTHGLELHATATNSINYMQQLQTASTTSCVTPPCRITFNKIGKTKAERDARNQRE